MADDDLDVTAWPTADLERRVLHALDFAAAAVADFGETGYDDPVRPALGFGPEKVVAEAAMLTYAARRARPSGPVAERADALARQLSSLVRSSRALADLAMHPHQVWRRTVPHVLLTAVGNRDEDFDAYAAARCARALSHAVDQPPTVLAERRWITSVWGRQLPPLPEPSAGTVLTRPFDLLDRLRETTYGLTHHLFYVTDFGATPVALTRPALLDEVDALVIRYLEHGDYDLVGELLMAWPQLRRPWSPVAAFAFRVLAHVEDAVGLLPCGNLDPARLATLTGPERTRYARAASYHTALVMGFACAVALRPGCAPPATLPGPAYSDPAWSSLRAVFDGVTSDWLAVFDLAGAEEKRRLAPLLGNLATVKALRQQDYPALHSVLDLTRRLGLPTGPMQEAAADLLGALSSAMEVSAPA